MLARAQSTARPVTPLGILAARLQAVGAQVADLEGGDALRAELLELAVLAGGLDPYLEAVATPESPALARLAERTRSEDWAARPASGAPGALEQEMLSGHVEGQFLGLLVHATQARRVLELGLFTGYSALAMAEALPPGGMVVACEIDAEVAALAQECFEDSPAGGRIDVRVGPAAATLQQLAADGDRFDLVFIDADKPGYVGYVDALLAGGLLEPHALICVDNTLMQGEPWAANASARSPNGAAIAHFNRWVAEDSRLAQVVVPLRDGITLIRQVA